MTAFSGLLVSSSLDLLLSRFVSLPCSVPSARARRTIPLRPSPLAAAATVVFICIKTMSVPCIHKTKKIYIFFCFVIFMTCTPPFSDIVFIHMLILLI
jgi:hypothetical protein